MSHSPAVSVHGATDLRQWQGDTCSISWIPLFCQEKNWVTNARASFAGWLFSDSHTNQCYRWCWLFTRKNWQRSDTTAKSRILKFLQNGNSTALARKFPTVKNTQVVCTKIKALGSGPPKLCERAHSDWSVGSVVTPGLWAGLPLCSIGGPFKVLSQERIRESWVHPCSGLGTGESDLSMMLW